MRGDGSLLAPGHGTRTPPHRGGPGTSEAVIFHRRKEEGRGSAQQVWRSPACHINSTTWPLPPNPRFGTQVPLASFVYAVLRRGDRLTLSDRLRTRQVISILTFLNVIVPFLALAHHRITSPWSIVFYITSSWLNFQVGGLLPF